MVFRYTFICQKGFGSTDVSIAVFNDVYKKKRKQTGLMEYNHSSIDTYETRCHISII